MVIELVYDLDQWQWGSRTKYPDGTKRPFKMDKIVIHWGGYTNPGDGQEDEMAIVFSPETCRLHLAYPSTWAVLLEDAQSQILTTLIEEC